VEAVAEVLLLLEQIWFPLHLLEFHLAAQVVLEQRLVSQVHQLREQVVVVEEQVIQDTVLEQLIKQQVAQVVVELEDIILVPAVYQEQPTQVVVEAVLVEMVVLEIVEVVLVEKV